MEQNSSKHIRDDIRRGNILKIVEPLMTTEPTKAVMDVQEVKTLVGEVRICWSCLSQTCRTRQLLSQRVLGKKLVNKYCPVKKVLLGDKICQDPSKGKWKKTTMCM